MNNSGNCEVCGIPQDTLFLDSGRYKCSLCCSPQIIKEMFSEATETSEKPFLNELSEVYL